MLHDDEDIANILRQMPEKTLKGFKPPRGRAKTDHPRHIRKNT